MNSTNPLWTPMLYYPQGISLAYHTLSLPQGLLALPWSLQNQCLLAYNLVTLASLASSGFAMTLLARSFTDRWLPATFAGTAFLLAPNYVVHVASAHLNLFSWQWALLACWAFLRLASKPSWPWAVAFGTFAALSLYTDLLFGVFLALLLPALYLTKHGPHLPSPAQLATMALGLLLALLLLAPLLGGLVAGYPQVAASAPWVANQIDVRRYSANAMDYLLPRSASEEGFLLYGRTVGIPTASFATGEKAFAGFVATILALVGFATKKSRWPLGALAVVAVVLSLGPEVRLSGTTLLPNYLFALYHQLPFAGISRTPGRFSLLTLAVMGILASGGLAYLMEKLKDRGTWIGLIAIALVVVELMPVPALKDPPPVPSEYVVNAMWERGRGTVLELPRLGIPSIYRMEYHQVYHGMPLITGYVSRPQFGDLSGDDLLEPQNVLSSLRVLNEDREGFFWKVDGNGAPRVDGLDARDQILSVLGYFDIRYLLLDKNVASPARTQQIRKIAAWLSQRPPIAEDPNFAVYQVSPTPKPAVTDFGEEWHGWEWNGQQAFRWSQGLSSIYLLTGSDSAVTVEFDAWSYGHPRELSITMDGREVARVPLAPTGTRTVALPLKLSRGMHRLILQASGDPLPEPPPGNRLLSFAISNPRLAMQP